MDIDTLIDLARAYGPWALVFLLPLLTFFFFLRIILDEERTALFRAYFYGALYKLTGKTEAEKKYVSNHVKAHLNAARRKMHFGTTLLPTAADVEWVAGEKGTTVDISEGEFIVRLDPSEEQKKNICLLATAIVKRTALVGIRRCLERPLQHAFDSQLTKTLLLAIGPSVVDWYLQEDYAKARERNKKTTEWFETLGLIEERGLLTRVLLVELEEFSRHIYGKPTRLFMAGEIEEFIHFIHAICARQFGQHVPATFCRAFMRVSVMLVAVSSKLIQKGTGPYVAWMNRQLAREVSSVYVLQYDKEYIGEEDPELYRKISEELKKLDKDLVRETVALKDFEFVFDCIDVRGRRRKAKVTRYRRPVPDS